MANTTLSVANVDFGTLKSSYKTYLQGQNLFKDFDFTGSNLNVLLDVMSYNTYMNNFYLNMVAAESFLDSAVLRDSVVSHAKTLNYLPSSYTSSKATLNIVITPEDTPAAITMPRYTAFTAMVESNTYTFTTNEGITIQADANGAYYVNDLDVYEGEIVTEMYQVNTANTSQRFVLNNKEIDINSLVVNITESTTNYANANYTRSLNTVGMDGVSNSYFIAPASNEMYEIQFGDGVLGRKLSHGNIVEAKYRRAAANNADSASVFNLAGDIQGYTNVAITTTQVSVGGGVNETIESIKFNAPKSITVQDRLVTVNDYKTLLKQQFNDIQAINVYGGEELSPPLFGKVVISVDLANADGISDQRKDDIMEYVKDRAPLSISPVVVNPEFLFVDISSEVVYNPNVTVKSDEEIKSAVVESLSTYTAAAIGDFDSKLRMSQLSRAIDDTDASVVNNNTTVKLQKTLVPVIGRSGSFTLNFDNEIYREIPLNDIFVDGTAPVTSSSFTFGSLINCFLRDDGSGIIQVIQDSQGIVQVVNSSIGTVDYTSGVVQITGLNVSAYSGAGITITAVPTKQTVSSSKNIILSYNNTPRISITQERI
jgi:hypothetical protein